VDLAIIFVPAKFVPKVLRECAQRGIRGAMIESGGFAESSDQGKQLQDSIIAIHRETGIRIWGPNCMGLVDAVQGLVFSFVLPAIWEKGLDPGNVSLVVQSGMLSAGFLIDIMSNGVMGISKVCSIGNKADINECDISVRIGELGLTYPQIKEIDLNPLIVNKGLPVAVDATIIMDE
jgi:acetyltransferase